MRGVRLFARAFRASPLGASARLGVDYLQYAAAWGTTLALLAAKHPVRLCERATGLPLRRLALRLFSRAAELLPPATT